ncbi:type II toxin-antitoxin system RelE/ParE family toxin [Chitinimonas sp. BJB300]|uniref:type II toxin-antitoxin system RelE/ParE family toxin n=1 Tax=Chitinimonas sp. BJB300 TaxID=1559339 RepID=UPI000C117046|nr:type II toxin-antitoxin system RelE/ParE family toxin [Chitinimonas sp. BJB300]PHV10019.1 plasmid stabilization protein [Chitinimonas sp. BJB300]TSJ83025.1 type II toxin-antitoxin system RelE/ParE family toxin [Chitinimonas sp. BJB300]
MQYIGEDSPATAKEFGDELKAKTQGLAMFPLLGKPGRIHGLRELVTHANYIIIYRILKMTDTVEILRVKHAKQHRPT